VIQQPASNSNVIIGLAALVVVIYGMQAASVLLVPFLVAVFVALIVVRPLLWMQSKRIPVIVATLAIVISIVLIISVIVAMLAASLTDFAVAVPSYQARLESLVTDTGKFLADIFGDNLYFESLDDVIDLGAMMRIVAMVLNSVREVMTNIFLIVLTLVFILLEASSMPTKISAALLGRGEFANAVSLEQTRLFLDNLGRYLGIKTLTSMATGTLVGLMTWGIGLDFPLLWAMLAFLLNYIPTIGSIIAAMPAILLAVVQLGLGEAVMIAVGFLGINTLLGNFLEPRMMGFGVGISPLIVFVGLFFWGWVFGPVGMLLSVPLTMMLKMAVESDERTRWIGMLLGTERDAEFALERW
jgi:predicted PurR-regulated permease PerM